MTEHTPDYTRQIAQFAAEVAQSDEPLPADVADICRNMMLNAAAAALAGAAHPDAIALTRIVRAMGGNGRSTIIGMGQRTSPVYAALVNGALVRLLDFDDDLPDDLLSNGPAANPTAAVFPAVMSLGEMHGFAGSSILNAFAAGCEVIACLSALPETASSAGSVGAATAAAMLLTPNVDAIASTVGLAASAGNTGIGYQSAGATALTCGHAAMHGVMAALMAFEGIVGTPAFSSHHFNSFRHSDSSRHSGESGNSLSNLGRNWRLADPGVTIRLYPCHPASHSVIDAILGLSQLHRFSPGDVATAHVGVTVETLQQLPCVIPADGWQARTSIGFIAAATLSHGQPLINFFSDDAVRDEGVRAMMERISVEATLSASPMSVYPAEVAVTLNDGQTLRHRVDHARGTPAMPLDAEELEAKFLYCTRYILPEDHIEEAIGSFRGIAEIENVTGMVSVLGG